MNRLRVKPADDKAMKIFFCIVLQAARMHRGRLQLGNQRARGNDGELFRNHRHLVPSSCAVDEISMCTYKVSMRYRFWSASVTISDKSWGGSVQNGIFGDPTPAPNRFFVNKMHSPS